ncbi:MAG: PilZ domain-containing protein [Mariprofundaceae bacterium]|nr:PilZ domain-containing protein [Mariprofundaceae bacterium]
MKRNGNARKFTRSNISIAIRLWAADLSPFDAIVIDLSLNGILIQTDTTLTIGSKCHISILLGHYMHELPLNAEGIVVRVRDGIMAIAFDAVAIESSRELQNMIVFHTDDPEQCLHEFNTLNPA